ncbi:MAG: thiamine pyrophosphate-dependent dehydrogenase E1 component subunit alpha [Verrucomicrobia bacterium]|nr:MAG: thiamine pyrophosphate-dependent dehydrogenase E1 component subunit alpha [Verrucomicrobiota bacterium]
MLQARVLDDKFASIYRAGKIHGGVFLGRGQEALSVASGLALRTGDIFAPCIRDQAGRLAFGEPILDAVRTYFGSTLGPMRGRDGNIHRGRPKEGLLAMISHLGAMISVVNGMLLSRRMQKREGSVGLACIGDGGMSTGAAHEALNQAGVEKLPLVVVVADNQFAYSTPTERQFACETLVDRADAYGLTGHSADGTNLEDCLKVVGQAVEKARAGKGPQLVVAKLLRLCGHGEHDDANYISAKLKNAPEHRDCLQVAEERILSERWSTPDELERWRKDAQRKTDDAVSTVQREPTPDPFAEKWQALATENLSEAGETPEPGPMDI